MPDTAQAPDPVNAPAHYTGHPSGVECIEIIEHMSFCLGNALKYLFRHADKGEPQQDLGKSIWYIRREGHNPSLPVRPDSARTSAFRRYMEFEPDSDIRSAMKLIWLVGAGTADIDNLETARWYVEREIERREKCGGER